MSVNSFDSGPASVSPSLPPFVVILFIFSTDLCAFRSPRYVLRGSALPMFHCRRVDSMMGMGTRVKERRGEGKGEEKKKKREKNENSDGEIREPVTRRKI